MNTGSSEDKEQIGYLWSLPKTSELFNDIVKRWNKVPHVRDFPRTERKECAAQLIYDKRDPLIAGAILVVRLDTSDKGRLIIYHGPVTGDISLFLPVSEDTTPTIAAEVYLEESRRTHFWVSLDSFHPTCDSAPLRILLLNYHDMERGGSTLVVKRSGDED